MGTGYRISYYVSGDGWDVTGLPDMLSAENLDEAFDQIKEFLRARMRDETTDETDHFNFSLFGPLPEDACRPDRRTPEQRLAEAESSHERHSALGDAAKSRFEAGDFDTARQYALALQESLKQPEAAWDEVGDAATVHIVLGRLALREGRIEEAKAHLTEAAHGEDSPVMTSFGPNMSLAHDLLLAGENQAVLDYFQACAKFWEHGAEDLDEWTMYVNAGRMPDFGANMHY